MTARFLVVDDDDSIRRLVTAVLRRHTYEADEASDGLEAIRKLSDRGYDAIFLDLMMPVCDGYEVLAFLREQQPAGNCVVIMTAARAHGVQELDPALIRRVLHKPFDIEDVLSAAAECVAKSPG
jgi:two-component system, NtrC family, response regulator AtoC